MTNNTYLCFILHRNDSYTMFLYVIFVVVNQYERNY
jgi:hypothetical protein